MTTTQEDTLAQVGKILQKLRALSQPALSAPPWEFVKIVDSVRRFSCDQNHLQEQLRADFGDEVMERVGVLRRTAEGDLQLAPVLAGEGHEFVVLRSAKEGPFIDIVSDAGSLVSSCPPLFNATTDWRISQLAKARESILVFSGEGDFALARKLGLASSTIAHLDRMQGDEISRLLQREAKAPARLPPIHHGDYEVVIIAFQLEKLDHQPPPMLQPLLQRLLHAESIMRVDTSGWLKVLPASPGAMERLKAAASFGNAPLVHKAIKGMLFDSKMSLAQYVNRGRSQSSQAYLRQRADLRVAAARVKQGTYIDALFEDKLNSYSDQYAAHFVEPAVAAAVKDPDPARKGMWLAVSHLAVLFRERELFQVAGNPRRLEDPKVAQEELQHVLSLADGLVKLQRGLARTQPRAG